MVLKENSVVNTNTIAITATLIKNLLRSFKNIVTAEKTDVNIITATKIITGFALTLKDDATHQIRQTEIKKEKILCIARDALLFTTQTPPHRLQTENTP